MIIKSILSRLPKTTIIVDSKPYLTRYYLFFKDRKWFNIYIHQFHSSDQPIELHSHPWLWALSIPFKGGYWEEYRTKKMSVQRRLVKPPTFNFITNKDFHRVDLLNEKKGSWSIFFAGPRTSEWGFWDRNTHEFKHWSKNPNAIP